MYKITNDEIRQGATDLEEIDAQRSDLDAERGSIRTTLDGLLSEDDSSRLRAERHRLSEVLHGYARDWAVRTIAENLIKEAQSKFERERQPDVIRHSERFFMNVTGRSYTKVFSPLGSTEIKVTDTVGNVKTPQELSRGTREQLLLSLRFGLIMKLGQRAERLPVIVDEALVNFDPSRGKKAAESFIELAQTKSGAGIHLPSADHGMVCGGSFPTRCCRSQRLFGFDSRKDGTECLGPVRLANSRGPTTPALGNEIDEPPLQ